MLPPQCFQSKKHLDSKQLLFGQSSPPLHIAMQSKCIIQAAHGWQGLMSIPKEAFLLTALRTNWIVLSSKYRGHTNGLLRLYTQILHGWKSDEVNPTTGTHHCKLAEFLQVRL